MAAPMADLAQSTLPPFYAQRLGPERAQAAAQLRKLFADVGLHKQLWPCWVDARSGLLAAIWVDLDDEPPLGQLGEALSTRYGPLLQDGAAALKLACAVPQVGFCSSSDSRIADLRKLCGPTTLVVQKTPAVFPSLPEVDLAPEAGRSLVLSALVVAQVGALVQGLAPLRLCSVVGAVNQPLVLDLNQPSASASGEWTPRDLVRLCAGSMHAAWVAIVGGALKGTVWGADEPLPADADHLLILPAQHALLRRVRLLRSPEARIANACLGCDLCSSFCPDDLLPHQAMRSFGPKASGPALSGCTGCGACSVVCPAELLPSQLLFDRLGNTESQRRETETPPPIRRGRLRIPTELMLSRLGLLQYQRR